MAPFNFIAHTVLYLLYFNYLYKIYSKEIKKDREKLGFFLKKYFEKILMWSIFSIDETIIYKVLSCAIASSANSILFVKMDTLYTDS